MKQAELTEKIFKFSEKNNSVKFCKTGASTKIIVTIRSKHLAMKLKKQYN